MIKNYYRALGLCETAEDVAIRAAFKLFAHRYHPDKWAQEKEYANRRMAEINEAHQYLTDPLLKAKYDRQQLVKVEYDLDYYRILGLLNDADELMIRAVYHALAKKHSNSPARLNQIEQAYKVLANPARRKAYDSKQRNSIPRGSSFSLWKIYLAYNLGFYVFLVFICLLAIAAKALVH